MLLGASGETKDDSSPKTAVEKPPSTPNISARDAEDMANAMLLDSPLLDIQRSDEKLPEEGGSGKLPEKEDGGKFSEGGDGKPPEETPTGKLVPFCTEEVLFLCS